MSFFFSEGFLSFFIPLWIQGVSRVPPHFIDINPGGTGPPHKETSIFFNLKNPQFFLPFPRFPGCLLHQVWGSWQDVSTSISHFQSSKIPWKEPSSTVNQEPLWIKIACFATESFRSVDKICFFGGRGGYLFNVFVNDVWKVGTRPSIVSKLICDRYTLFSYQLFLNTTR